MSEVRDLPMSADHETDVLDVDSDRAKSAEDMHETVLAHWDEMGSDDERLREYVAGSDRRRGARANVYESLDRLEAAEAIGPAERAALEEAFAQPLSDEILTWETTPQAHITAAQIMIGLRSPDEALDGLASDTERAFLEQKLPVIERCAEVYLASAEAFEL